MPLFFQNDQRCCTQQNEWVFVPGTKKLRVYSTSQPTDVKVTSVDPLVTINGAYITFNGIDFLGSNYKGFTTDSMDRNNLIIQNCNIKYCAHAGISIQGNNILVENNVISEGNVYGMSVTYGSGSIVRGNTCQNNGIYLGMSEGGWTGLSSNLDVGGSINILVEKNRVINSGYVGIAYYGQYVTIKNNFIDTFCNVLDDGGGIYSYIGSERDPMVGNVMDGNVIINGIGAPYGVANNGFPTIGAGIYMDEQSSHIELKNNSIYNCSSYGFFNNLGFNINVHDNTVVGCTYSQYRINDWNDVTTYTLNNNIFVAKSGQGCLYISSGSNVIQNIGTLNYNRYARPINDTTIFEISQPNQSGNEMKTLTQWKTFSSQDANSNGSPISISTDNNLHFVYNETNTAKDFTLSTTFTDITNTTRSGTLTLQPYTSIVLLGAGTITETGGGSGVIHYIMSGTSRIVSGSNVVSITL